MKKCFLKVELKRFEVQLDEYFFTVIERGRGHPRGVSFPKSTAAGVASFYLGA